MEDILTKREKEVIETIVIGQCFTLGCIAQSLNIAKSTVHTYLIRIYQKLNLPTNNIASIVWYYYNRGK